MYDYVGQGSVRINGCSTFFLIPRVDYKYKPGDVVYYKPKAETGKLEKIVIKKVHVVRNNRTGGNIVFMYFDTLNSLYNEFDLVYESEALLLIKAYIEKQIYFYRSAIQRCSQW
jgi:hypothetical protein